MIRTAAKRLDDDDFPPDQVGIQFVQIGRDADATAALEKLDGDLSESCVRVSYNELGCDGQSQLLITCMPPGYGGHLPLRFRR